MVHIFFIFSLAFREINNYSQLATLQTVA